MWHASQRARGSSIFRDPITRAALDALCAHLNRTRRTPGSDRLVALANRGKRTDTILSENLRAFGDGRAYEPASLASAVTSWSVVMIHAHWFGDQPVERLPRSCG